MAAADMVTISAGEAIANPWIHLDDDAELSSGSITLSLQRLTGDTAVQYDSTVRLGVRLPPGTELSSVKPFIPRLSLIAVEFPDFRDGRGFSLARSLREHCRYDGEIRALGHLLPDQYVFLLRCGVDTVEVPSCNDLAPWRQALSQFSFAYQPAADAGTPLSPLRRMVSNQRTSAYPTGAP